jgi:hypothetical protein
LNKKKKDKKNIQLGMNYSTASGRLVKDILFKLIQDTHQAICYRCKKSLTRDSFSIEHIEPWLDSEDPLGLFFNLDNISFSHLSCNISAHRVPNKKYHTKEERKEGSRKLNKKFWDSLGKEEQQRRRKDNYLKNSC